MPEPLDPQENENSEGNNEGQQAPNPNEENLKQLREKAKKADEIPNIQKELAMVKAGIDTDSPLGKFFFDGYKGELTKEAVIAAAQEIGLLEKQAPDPGVTQEEKSATQERQQLVSGAAQASEQSGKHPTVEGKENAKRILDEGGTYEQAGAGYLSTIMQRYKDGDTRGVRDPRQER